MEVGFGSGYQPDEFQRFGLDIEAKQRHFDEGLEIITKALAEEVFSHNGELYTIPDSTLFPRHCSSRTHPSGSPPSGPRALPQP